NTSGDTYDVYVEIGNHATGVNIQWDYTSNASVTIHTSPTYTANKPTGLTDGTVYVIYSSHIKPTATDVGALPITGGNLNGGLTTTGEIISKSGNGLRIAYGNYGFFIRNDGSNTYFMLTDSGNSLGTYNRLRPLIINNANGAVTIGNGLDVTGGINGSLNGNASTATKLQTARKISGVSFDGSADITLTAENVSAFALRATGTYADTSGAVPWNAESGAYNVTRSGDSYIVANFYTGVGSCRTLQIRAHHKNGGLYYRSSRDGYGFEEGWAQIYTKKDSIPGVNTTGNQNTTGNAATATKLQTARTIGGVSFDGSANINLPGVNTTGNQNTTGNAATATKLQTARNINGVPFDGTKDITLTPKDLDAYSKSEVQSALAGKQPLDNTLTNLSGKDVAGLLAYLQLGEAAKRDVGTGNNQLPDMSAFGMSRNGQTAWDILPNGMIRQVGTVTLTPVGNFNAQVLGGVTYYTHYYRVNFPRQFPNAQIATLATLASYSFSTQSSMAGKSLATHRDTDSGTDVSRTRFTVSYTTPNLGEIPTLHFEAIGY
ncbi:hypothetical protein LOV17_004918, partial [Salmonella enterica]|nr:hypothetical protein [Salmonella enterica]